MSCTFERIHLLIINNNMNIAEFCKAVGVSTGNYGDWQRGKSKPGIEALTKIADTFNVSLDYLVGRDKAFPAHSPDAYELMKIYDDLDREGKIIVLGTAYQQKQRMEGFVSEDQTIDV